AAAEGPAGPAAAGPHPFDETLALFWSEPEGPPDLEPLADIFRRHEAAFADVRATVHTFTETGAQAAVSPDEARAVLRLIGDDITRTPDLRRQAQAVAHDDLQANEFAGALTVLLHNLDDWNWPAEGFALRPLWSRTRWRPYLDEDLLTLLFQNLVGLRWGMTLKTAFQNALNTKYHGGRGPGGLCGEKKSRATNYAPLQTARAQQHDKLFLPMIPQTLAGARQAGGYGPSAGLTPDATDTFQELLLFL